MSNDSHNGHIFNSILSNLNAIRAEGNLHKTNAYIKEMVVQLDEDIEVKEDFNTPHQMKILKRKLRKTQAKKTLVDAFQKKLKDDGGAEIHIETKTNFNIEKYTKSWLQLTNDQRSNRINDYLKRDTVHTEDEKKKMRFILVQGITGKLLESTSLKYDAENAQILAIQSLQYNPTSKEFYFI
jgi:hypothetical protein